MNPANLSGQTRGSVTIELALTLAFLFTLLTCLVFVGVLLYDYEIAKNASADAARYLSSAEARDMQNSEKVGQHLAIAQKIVDDKLKELVLGTVAPSTSIACNGASCSGFWLPQTVTVTVQISLPTSSFLPMTNEMFGPRVGMVATTTLPYVGI